MSMRLMIVDDHDLIRENIISFVGKQPDIEVIGEAKDGETAVELARILSPDIVLMDISMPKLNGIEAAGYILRNNDAVRVIILSAHSDKYFVVAGYKAGVSGYVLNFCIFKVMLIEL